MHGTLPPGATRIKSPVRNGVILCIYHAIDMKIAISANMIVITHASANVEAGAAAHSRMFERLPGAAPGVSPPPLCQSGKHL